MVKLTGQTFELGDDPYMHELGIHSTTKALNQFYKKIGFYLLNLGSKTTLLGIITATTGQRPNPVVSGLHSTIGHRCSDRNSLSVKSPMVVLLKSTGNGRNWALNPPLSPPVAVPPSSSLPADLAGQTTSVRLDFYVKIFLSSSRSTLCILILKI